jgi:mannose-6-phosphate isomerase-like protein (cupin superfamily)
MADYVHMPIDEMESIWAGGFKRAAGSLGVEAFGLGVADLPPDFDHVPKHAHTFDDQEEIYFLLGGNGWLEANDQRIELAQDQVIRVGPTVSRRGLAGPDGVRQLIVGAMPGRAYERIDVWEPGAKEPMFTDLPGVKAAHEHQSTDDYTALRLDEMDPITDVFPGVTFFPVRRSLGITSVGVNVIDIQPAPDADNGSGHPVHDHVATGHEEVYVPIAGSGEVDIDGERIAIAPGEMIRIAPEAKRQLIPSSDGLRVIAISGKPGGAYEPPNLRIDL